LADDLAKKRWLIFEVSRRGKNGITFLIKLKGDVLNRDKKHINEKLFQKAKEAKKGGRDASLGFHGSIIVVYCVVNVKLYNFYK
jgi:hypothetical protein